MKLMVIDGNSIVNRAFYGIRPLSAPDGTPTNAVYGFLTIMQKLLKEEKPEALAIAFDLKAPTFRHLSYEGYKAQRKGMPEELAVQMPILKELVDSLGVKRLELEGFEADDLLGTVSEICNKSGDTCVIVTGDKDSFQLITEHSYVKHIKSRMGKTETIDYTKERFFDEYGFEPKKIIDLKAFMGDTSDNIPGVRGVGEKTAMSLIQNYGTINNIYDNLDSLEIKDSVKKKLMEGKDDAFMSYNLATIVLNAPIEFDITSSKFDGNFSPAYAIFKRLGFNALIEKWGMVANSDDVVAEIEEKKEIPSREVLDAHDLTILSNKIKTLPYISIELKEKNLDSLVLCDGETVYNLSWGNLGEDYNDFLRLVFSDEIKKISHNVKDLMGVLLEENLGTDGFIFDTALASYLLEPTESKYDLERITPKYLGQEALGADGIFQLYEVLNKKLKETGMDSLYNEVELPLCAVLADMEHSGFLVDKMALMEFSELLKVKLEGLTKEIYELSGEEFNINSPKQLGVILFENMGLPHGKKTKTGYSTNQDVLDKLRFEHPIVEKILEYRQISKLKSTYCDGLAKVIAKDGRIHTSFQMTVTATGRLSSTEPNLQNIPVRSALGAEIRKMFVAPKGKVLVDADYSQIELRLLAHISDDETMKNAFINGEDIHSVTASQVFNIPLENVTKLQRSHAKAVNFGIVYGIGAFSLSQDIGVFVNEAKAYIDAYLAKYSGVREYMKDIVEKAKADGEVKTLFGRVRSLPELKSSNFNMRSFGERVALNTPIQGTAADVIKLAMVNVHKRLKSENLDAKLILQVHDELIVECFDADCQKVKEILTYEMEKAVSYSVPLIAEANSGKSWSEAK